jgi:uncharacterized alkaline shock family protein YloU
VVTSASEPSDGVAADVVAAHARDAALGAKGVSGLSRRGVRVSPQDGRVDLELHLACELGESLPAVCRHVAERVRAHVEEMTDLSVGMVAVLVDAVVPPER